MAETPMHLVERDGSDDRLHKAEGSAGGDGLCRIGTNNRHCLRQTQKRLRKGAKRRSNPVFTTDGL